MMMQLVIKDEQERSHSIKIIITTTIILIKIIIMTAYFSSNLDP